jgi:hypothetical protein
MKLPMPKGVFPYTIPSPPVVAPAEKGAKLYEIVQTELKNDKLLMKDKKEASKKEVKEKKKTSVKKTTTEKKKKVDYERDMECMNQIKYIIDEHNKIEDDDDLKINIYPSYNTEELMFNFRQSKINTMKVISTEKYQMNESYLNRVYSKIEDIYFNYEKDGRSILYPS